MCLGTFGRLARSLATTYIFTWYASLFQGISITKSRCKTYLSKHRFCRFAAAFYLILIYNHAIRLAAAARFMCSHAFPLPNRIRTDALPSDHPGIRRSSGSYLYRILFDVLQFLIHIGTKGSISSARTVSRPLRLHPDSAFTFSGSAGISWIRTPQAL